MHFIQLAEVFRDSYIHNFLEYELRVGFICCFNLGILLKRVSVGTGNLKGFLLVFVTFSITSPLHPIKKAH